MPTLKVNGKTKRFPYTPEGMAAYKAAKAAADMKYQPKPKRVKKK